MLYTILHTKYLSSWASSLCKKYSLYITYVQKKQRAVIPWKMIESKNPDNMRWGTWLQ